MKTKNKSGISLIVLVITIIVIIILAAAVILTVSNNNPVEKANDAVVSNDEAVLKEAAALEFADLVLANDGKLPDGAIDQIRAALIARGFSPDDAARVEITDKGGITVNPKPTTTASA